MKVFPSFAAFPIVCRSLAELGKRAVNGIFKQLPKPYVESDELINTCDKTFVVTRAYTRV